MADRTSVFAMVMVSFHRVVRTPFGGGTLAIVALAWAMAWGSGVHGQILSAKRGFADTGANYGNLQATGAGWYYTWGTGTGSPAGFGAKHYPMFWNSPSDATINTVRNRAGVEWVLGFNEPERTDQANMSVTSALDAWSRICDAFAGTSVKLASPAVSDNTAGRDWIASFMSQLNDRRTNAANPKYNPNLRVDAIAFHWYGYSNPNNPTEAANWFMGSVDYYRNTYGVAVMPTEFAIHDWGGSYTDQQISDANKLFLDNVLPRLDSRSYVPGYAWYHWFTDSRLYGGSPPLPTPMAYRYIGAVASGSTANIGGQNLGEYVAYLTGGTLTMTGTAPGAVNYISALANTSSVTGSLNWGLTGTSTWLRVQADAVLQKSGTNRVSLDGTVITNDGIIDVTGGSLRLTGSTTLSGGGSLRVGSGAALVVDQTAGSFTLDEPLALAGGAIEGIAGSVRLTGTSDVWAQTTLSTGGTMTAAGPLRSGMANAGLTKSGSGMLVLSSGANTYSGPTRITAGMLAISGRLYTGAITDASAITVGSGTLYAVNFSEQPVGSLGSLPGSSDRIMLDAGVLRLAGSGTTSRGFTIGASGATIELQAGVSVTFVESGPASQLVSAAGGGLTLHATSGSGTLAKSYIGSGSLLKTGTGTWTLAGDNAFMGDTRIAAGMLRVTNVAGLAGSTLDMNAADSGTIGFVGRVPQVFGLGGLTGTRNLANGGHWLRVGGNGESTAFAGGLSGSGGLVKIGSGTLTFSGSNAFTGGIAVEQGMLRLSGSASLPAVGSIRIDSGAVVALMADVPLEAWLKNGRIAAGSAGAIAVSGSFADPLDLRSFPGLSLGGSGAASLTSAITPAANGYRFGGGDGVLRVSSTLAGAGGLTKIGPDTTVITGSNSFTGGVVLRGGMLQAGSAAALGSEGTITFAGGGLQFSAGNAVDYSPRFSTDDGQAFRIDTSGRSVTFAAPLESAGGSLTKLGSGTLGLAPTNAYDGDTRIVGGVLQVTGTATFAGSTLDMNAADAGALDLVAASPQAFALGGLMGVRNVAMGGHSLLIGSNDRSTAYAGTVSGSGGIVKRGAGTLTLTGANSYTGGTTIAEGILEIGDGGLTGSVIGPILNHGSLVLRRGGAVSLSAAISGTGSVSQAGPGVVTLSGSSTYTGPTRVEAGTLQVTGVLNSASRLVAAGGTFAHARTGLQTVDGLTVAAGASTINTTVAAGTLALGAMARETGGVITFATRSGAITTTATNANGILGAWGFTGSGTGTRYATVSAGTITPYASATVLSSTSAFGGVPSGDTSQTNYSVTSSGTFAAMGLARSVNTIAYSGNGAAQPAANAVTLTINGIMNSGAGQLVIGGSPRMDIVVGAARDLVINTVTQNVVLANSVLDHASGASGLTKAGLGTLVLNGSNGYTGTTTIGGGTLQVGSGSSGASLASATIVNSGVLVFNHSDDLLFRGSLAGTGRLENLGGGSLKLTGSSSFAGDIAIDGGTLMIAGGGSLGSRSDYGGRITLAGGARFSYESTVPQAISGDIAGNGSLAVTGQRLVLAGDNSFTGDVVLGSNATLVIASPGALAGQALTAGISLGSATGTVVDLANDGSGRSVMLRGEDGFATTIVAGRPAGSVGPGLRHELAPGMVLGGGLVSMAAGISTTDRGAALVIPSIALTGSRGNTATTLVPMTASAHVGTVSGFSGGGFRTLGLAGTNHDSTVSGGISDGSAVVGVVKSDTGTWTLLGINTYTGTTAIDAGTLRVAGGNGFGMSPAVINSGATLEVARDVTVKAASLRLQGGTLEAAGATLIVNGTAGIGSLTVDAGALTGLPGLVISGGGRVTLPPNQPMSLALTSLAVDTATGGRLDIGRGLVEVAAGGITTASLRTALIAGRNHGAWNGTSGIASAAAAAGVASGIPRAVGWLDDGTGSFQIAFAAPGDSNIDGLVDVLDVANVLSGGLFDAAAPADWMRGDYNYDGIVDVLDAADFLSTGLFNAGYYSPEAESRAIAAVPEPAAIRSIPVACLALLAAGRCRISRRS